MHRPLNIPLEGQVTTRRDYRRVVALCGAITAGAFIALCAFRMQFVLNSTLGLRPENTTLSVNVLATPGTIRLLTEHMGTYPLLPGLPIAVSDVLAKASSEFSVHVTDDGKLAVSVDTVIPDEDISTLSAYGYAATRTKNATVIAPEGVRVENLGITPIIRAFLPGMDGSVRTFGQNADNFPVRISNKGIRLIGVGLAAEQTSSPVAPSGAAVLGQVAIPAGNYLAVPKLLESIVPIPATFHAFETLAEHGGNLLLTSDERGIGYFLSSPPGETNVEELASIGKDIMNRQTLTTQAWTTQDGEKFSEIRGNVDEITTDIRAEESFTLITVANTSGETVRLARTPSLLTISNRAIVLEDIQKPRSECLYNAHTWMETEMFTIFDSTALNTNAILATFLTRFEEIAINARKTQLCW